MAMIENVTRAGGGNILKSFNRPDVGALLARVGGWAITLSLAVIFLWFGSLKFIPFEQTAVVGIVKNNPLISWLYSAFGIAGGTEFLGCFEFLTGLLIAGRIINPKLSVVGAAMGVWSFFLTMSCMFTTPGFIQPGWTGTLALSPTVGAFLVKDIVLFSACLWLLGTSLTEAGVRPQRT